MNMGKKLVHIAKAIGVQFTLEEKEISPEEVFAETGLLPAVLRRADQLSSFCLGYGLGITFDEMPGAKLGVVPKYDDTTPNSLRLLCATEILYEIIEASPNRTVIALDDLMYD
jgi:intracellular multiplication protein IcmS